MHSNFLNFTSQIISYRIGSQRANLNFINDKVKSSKTVFDKVWLLDKIRELSVKEGNNNNSKKITRKMSFSG
jgi:hypothetical protein